MVKGKKKKLQDSSEKELRALVNNLDRELFELRGELATQRKLEKPHQIKEKRREKARALTILTQKQKEAV